MQDIVFADAIRLLKRCAPTQKKTLRGFAKSFYHLIFNNYAESGRQHLLLPLTPLRPTV